MPFAPQVLTCLGHTVAGYLNRLGSYPTRSSTPEATATIHSFFKSDKPVYTTSSIRPIGPVQSKV